MIFCWILPSTNGLWICFKNGGRSSGCHQMAKIWVSSGPKCQNVQRPILANHSYDKLFQIGYLQMDMGTKMAN